MNFYFWEICLKELLHGYNYWIPYTTRKSLNKKEKGESLSIDKDQTDFDWWIHLHRYWRSCGQTLSLFTLLFKRRRGYDDREKEKKGPISKEKTNTHSKKPHDLSNWAIYLDDHGVIKCISEAWNETYQRGVEGWRVCPQGHVALGAVGTGTVDGVCEGRDPGVGAEQTRPVLAGTHRLSRVGVRHYGPTILTTWGGRWR